MKVLVIYDSLFGNTEKIANAIKDGCSSEDVSIIRAKDATMEQIQLSDLIIVGSPTHGGRPFENTQRLLASISNDGLAGKKAAAFDTGMPVEEHKKLQGFIIKMFGYAAGRIAESLKSKGAEVIAKETFFVMDKEGPLKEGELERAKEWGSRLLN